jgi:hypothetical protein
MANLFGGILSVVLSVILIASVVVPIIYDQNTTGWTSADTTLFGLVSLVAIFGLIYGVANVFGML